MWSKFLQADVDNKLSDKEKEAVKDFALYIIHLHNSNSTITVWPYICSILLQVFFKFFPSFQCLVFISRLGFRNWLYFLSVADGWLLFNIWFADEERKPSEVDI